MAFARKSHQDNQPGTMTHNAFDQSMGYPIPSFAWYHMQSDAQVYTANLYDEIHQNSLHLNPAYNVAQNGVSIFNDDFIYQYPQEQQSESTSNDDAQVEAFRAAKIARRRGQNREAQRAHRQRREKRIEELLDQHSEYQKKYQLLLKSYGAQAEEVKSLKKRVVQLRDCLNALQFVMQESPSFPSKFDLVPKFGQDTDEKPNAM